MHRCFIEPERWHEQRIEPSSDEAHHLRHVLRVADGDVVTVFDGAGREASTRVRGDLGRSLVLDVQNTMHAAERPFDLVLIQAIPKGSRMDLIVEKATELGVSRLVPVLTERVVVRLDAAQSIKRGERWARVAKSASKQCGTPWLPQIDAVQSFSDMLVRASEYDVVLLGSLAEGVQPLHVAVAAVRAQSPRSVAVIIGPEGDFSPSEIASALEVGAIPVSFGELILRAETAAIYALSVLSYEFLWR